MTEFEPPEDPAPERESDDVALEKLMRFQFVVLSGLFALAIPGVAVMSDEPVNLVYIPALLIHGFFLWRLWRFDRGLLPFVWGFIAVVVVMPWMAWGLRKTLGLEPLVTAPILFAVLILIALGVANKRSRGPE